MWPAEQKLVIFIHSNSIYFASLFYSRGYMHTAKFLAIYDEWGKVIIGI